MANTRYSQVSFSRGEITPAIYNRTDMGQRDISLKTLKNGFINQEGCVSNRSGFEYIGEVKYSNKETRLIPFAFSNAETYVIEAGDKYFRFIQNGGYVLYPDDYGVEDGYNEYERNDISRYEISATNDNYIILDLYVIIPENIEYHLWRFYADMEYSSSVTISDLDDVIIYLDEEKTKLIGPILEITENYIKINWHYHREDEEKVALQGQIVEIETPYLENELQNIKYTQSADVLTLCHINHPPKTLSRYAHYDWRLEDIDFQPSIEAPKNLNVTWTGSVSKNTKFYKYCVTAVNTSTDDESSASEIFDRAKGHKEAYWETSEYFTLTWDAVTGASEYYIYKEVNGVMGFIGKSTSCEFVDDCIEPDTASTAPMVNNPFEDNNNPSCCTYFQQRKIYGNTSKKPQTLYASRTSNFDNFNYSRPLNSTDCVEIAFLDREINEIKHLVPFKDLIVLTSNNEYKVNGTDGIFQATPPPASIIQSCYGASDVQPIISGDMVLFVQSGGMVLRDLGYDYLSDGYKGIELSIFASHLFESKEVKYLTYAKEPYRLVYVIFLDGSLAVLTYNKDQQIFGWARWETAGLFISATTVREGQEDTTYFIIQRGNKKYVERQKTRIVKDAKYGIFLDSALASEFDEAVNSLSGLEHLAGKTVTVLADGGVIENLTVGNNGTLNLPYKAKIITVGLPYLFEMETLGVEGENTHGLKKSISAVSVNVLNSREDFFIESNTGFLEQMQRGLRSINDAGYLYTGSKKAVPLNEPNEIATIKIIQKYPLPLTVTSISATVNIEDISDSQG